MRVARSTGVVGGVALIVLGAWGVLIPFLGPYFNYGFAPDVAWHFTFNRLWLEILPGVAVAVGGLILIVAARRTSGVVGGWLALAGGVWFIVGPAISLLWASRTGGLLRSGVGAPIGGQDRTAAEAIGLFYGLGALITTLAVFAIGRFVWRPGLVDAAASPTPPIPPAAAATPSTQAESPSGIREREPAVH
jgi:hypothetical protein